MSRILRITWRAIAILLLVSAYLESTPIESLSASDAEIGTGDLATQNGKSHPFVLRTVVIDPGHGGKDPGYVGSGGVLEKSVNLQIAHRLALELRQRGLNVDLLRNADQTVSLEDRARLANVHPAQETLFVSLHCNSWEGKNASGVETYVFDFKASDDDAARVALRENFGQEMTPFDYIMGDLHHRGSARYSNEAARHIQSTLSRRLGVRDRQVRRAPLRVLGYAQLPAVLVEIGFLTNPREARLLQQAEHQNKVASALADGIQSFQREVQSWDRGTEGKSLVSQN